MLFLFYPNLRHVFIHKNIFLSIIATDNCDLKVATFVYWPACFPILVHTSNSDVVCTVLVPILQNFPLGTLAGVHFFKHAALYLQVVIDL